MDFEKLLQKAQASRFGMWKLNFLLHRFIPFNRPHNLTIKSITKSEVKVEIPYQKSNLNHIKGLHACGLATVAEYASGLLLLYKLGVKKYRIIMESIHVEYHYQGKKSATAVYTLSDEELEKEILAVLEKEGKATKECEIGVFDADQNKLCTVTTMWQIKSWEKVKTKVD
ncbi:MAG: YiiD C-terminal domain-containing protein [Vicingaceae bacterium]